MDSLWAYFNKGRTSRQDYQKWHVPHDVPPASGRNDFISNFFSGSRNFLNTNPTSATHFIGFDGKQWHFAHSGVPNSFLDPTKFDNLYSYDGRGRSIGWMHGYVTQDSVLPTHIPHLNNATVASLHETNIIPHWKAGKQSIVPTQYQPIVSLPNVELGHYLPPEAIEQLKVAQTAGKPIMLGVHQDTKAFTNLTNDYLEFSPPQSAAAKPPVPSPTEAAASGGFWKKALNFTHAEGGVRWGKVTSVAVGAVAVAGGLYLLLGPKEKSWAQREAERPTPTALGR